MRALRRAERGAPRGQHAHGPPERRLLPRRSSCCRRSAPRVILLYGGYQAIDGNVTIGVLVAFVGYLQSFFDPIQQLSNLYVTYQQGMAAIDKIFDLLDTEPDMQDAPGARELGRIGGDIEFDRRVVQLRGRAGRRRRPSRPGRCATCRCASRPGETLALVGETGAGKSTLAKLVARFYDPQRGRRAGRRPRPARGHAGEPAHASSAIVPQEGFLFSGHRAREHRCSAGPGASELELVGAARAVGAHEFIKRAARGLRDRGRRARQPAVGRPAPAGRAGAGADRRPAHPGAGRGDRERRRARRGRDRAGPAASCSSDRTSIVIAHRLSTVMNADRIAVLERRRGRRDRHARRADRGRRRLLAAVPQLGRAGRGVGPQRPRRRTEARAILGAVSAGSSNGRTPGSGPGNRGSSPCPAASTESPAHAGLFSYSGSRLTLRAVTNRSPFFRRGGRAGAALTCSCPGGTLGPHAAGDGSHSPARFFNPGAAPRLSGFYGALSPSYADAVQVQDRWNGGNGSSPMTASPANSWQ